MYRQRWGTICELVEPASRQHVNLHRACMARLGFDTTTCTALTSAALDTLHAWPWMGLPCRHGAPQNSYAWQSTRKLHPSNAAAGRCGMGAGSIYQIVWGQLQIGSIAPALQALRILLSESCARLTTQRARYRCTHLRWCSQCNSARNHGSRTITCCQRLSHRQRAQTSSRLMWYCFALRFNGPGRSLQKSAHAFDGLAAARALAQRCNTTVSVPSTLEP